MKKRPAPPASQGPVLGFVCTPLGARMTRASCGARHKNAGTPWEPGARKVKVWSEQCARCETGRAHAKGSKPRYWPDGTPVLETWMVPVKALLRTQPCKRKERMAEVG